MHKDVAKALEEACVGVMDRFCGSSSGLGAIGEAIARDHAKAAVISFLRALPNSTDTANGLALWYPTRILVELTEEREGE